MPDATPGLPGAVRRSDSTHTAAIPAGALLDLNVTGGGGSNTAVDFGWTDTTAG